MAGIQVNLKQYVGRELHEKVVEFIVGDDEIKIPLVPFCFQIIRTEGFIGAVGLIPAEVRYLGAVTRHTENQVTEFSLLSPSTIAFNSVMILDLVAWASVSLVMSASVNLSHFFSSLVISPASLTHPVMPHRDNS